MKVLRCVLLLMVLQLIAANSILAGSYMNYIVITDEAHRSAVMALSARHTLWWTDANGKVAVAGWFNSEPTGYPHFLYSDSATSDWRSTYGWVDRPEYAGAAIYVDSHASEYLAMSNPIYRGAFLDESLPVSPISTVAGSISSDRTASGYQLNVFGYSHANMLFRQYSDAYYWTAHNGNFITVFPNYWTCLESQQYNTSNAFMTQKLTASVITYRAETYDPDTGVGTAPTFDSIDGSEYLDAAVCSATGGYGPHLANTMEFYAPFTGHASGANGYITGAFGFLYSVRVKDGWNMWDVRAAYRATANHGGVWSGAIDGGGYGMIQMQQAEALGSDAGALPLYGPVALAVRLRDNLELKWRNFRQSRWRRTKLVMYASEPTPGVTRPSDGVTVYDGTGEYVCVAADTSNAGNLWIAGFGIDAAGNASALQACDVISVPARSGGYRNPISPVFSSESDGSYRVTFTPNPNASSVGLFYCGEEADVAACLDKTPDQMRLIKSYANASPIIVGKFEYGSLNALHPMFVLLGRDSEGVYGSTEEVCTLSMTLSPKSLGARMEGVKR